MEEATGSTEVQRRLVSNGLGRTGLLSLGCTRMHAPSALHPFLIHCLVSILPKPQCGHICGPSAHSNGPLCWHSLLTKAAAWESNFYHSPQNSHTTKRGSRPQAHGTLQSTAVHLGRGADMGLISEQASLPPTAVASLLLKAHQSSSPPCKGPPPCLPMSLAGRERLVGPNDLSLVTLHTYIWLQEKWVSLKASQILILNTIKATATSQPSAAVKQRGPHSEQHTRRVQANV